MRTDDAKRQTRAFSEEAGHEDESERAEGCRGLCGKEKIDIISSSNQKPLSLGKREETDIESSPERVWIRGNGRRNGEANRDPEAVRADTDGSHQSPALCREPSERDLCQRGTIYKKKRQRRN